MFTFKENVKGAWKINASTFLQIVLWLQGVPYEKNVEVNGFSILNSILIFVC